MMEADPDSGASTGARMNDRHATTDVDPTPEDNRPLGLALSDGVAPVAGTPAPVVRPEAVALDEATTALLLARLPAPTPPAAPAHDGFALREASLPPPRTGLTALEPFPPATDGPDRAAPSAAVAPLRVVRRTPVGDVPIAPGIAVTFSAPMVALDSVAAAVTARPPAILEPPVAGEWRWMDTRTLVFAPARERLPMATSFRVTVPAGTSSAGGAVLEAAEAWAFATPAPTVVDRYPVDGPAARTTPIALAFDQAIDPEAVAARLAVMAGRTRVTLRTASADEVAADPAVARLVAAHPRERVVVAVPVEPLPADESVSVTLDRGTPSAEGPLATPAPQGWSFRSAGPFRVVRGGVGWRGGDRKGRPGDPWVLELSNPVDPATFDEAQVRVEPPVPQLRAFVQGDQVVIAAAARARSAYAVDIGPGPRDVFGQDLEPGRPIRLEVDAPEPGLALAGGDHVILDPAGGTRLTVGSIGLATLRVEAFALAPRDWKAWTEFARGHWRDDRPKPPGERVLSTRLEVPGDGLAWTHVDLDLAPLLAGGLGQLGVVVRPDGAVGRVRGRRPEAAAWVQVTRMGLDAFADAASLLAWVTDLATGAPIGGVHVELGEASATTDATGLATLPLDDEANLVVARVGSDVAILPHDTWGGSWQGSPRAASLAFLVFDDRGLYRPGETVRVKGWIRPLGAGPTGDVGALPEGVDAVEWTAVDPLGNEIAEGTAPVDALGGFDLAVELPATVNLGDATIRLHAHGWAGSDAPASEPGPLSLARRFRDRLGGLLRHRPHAVHRFRVAEFRRPEYEVTATAVPGPVVAGEPAAVSVHAAYYAGGPLPFADVTWDVTARPGRYAPPGWDRFTFGSFVPWWRRGDDVIGDGEADDQEAEASLEARTGADGDHHLRIDTTPPGRPRPWVVTAEATVADVNRQAWTASAAFVVHPSALCVGLRGERAFVAADEPLAIEAVVVDLDGRIAPGRAIALRAARLEHRQVRGAWREVVTEAVEQTVESGSEPVATRFDGLVPGRWRVTARVADHAGRPHESELEAWVAGVTPSRRGIGEDELVLVPDRRSYAPGETAEVLIVAPFTPAEALLTLHRRGLLREERFTVTEPSHALRIPIEDGMTPNVHVAVALVGAVPREDAPGASRPAFAAGTVELAVPPAHRTLDVVVEPREPGLRPGGETVLDVAVHDAGGRPVKGGVAVVVVDEAVLALAGYRAPDPAAVFYPEREAGVQATRSREHVLLARPGELEAPPPAGDALELAVPSAPASFDLQSAVDASMPAPAPMMLARSLGPGPSAPEPIRARTDFAALALFAAAVETDVEGRATIPLRLPDNLTRYRVMAVATDGARRFGRGEAAVTARLPLMVRPSAPRFLNWGDRFDLPVVVQNQAGEPLVVDVAVRAANAALTAGAGRRLTVPANDRAEVRFAAATDGVGEARFEVAAAAGPDADAATVTLPVRTPATTEAFAVHGTLDEGEVAQPVRAPEGVAPSFGGLEVTTSSTAVAALTDAMLYLASYPFECAEQLASRILGIAALRDVLAAFRAEGLPEPGELEAAVGRDVGRLRALQNADGGFGFWRRGEDSWPYLGAHVANALARARTKGHAVPDAMVDGALGYLRGIERRFPRDYPADVRAAIEAYALDVRARLGDPDPGRARHLLRANGVDRLSPEALGWLLPVLGPDPRSAGEAEAARRQLANRVVETPGGAHLVARYEDGTHLLLASDRRADAVVLEALIADQPSNDLVPKLAAGLLAHRTAGRWGNTQENAFVLLALGRYFDAYEGVTPDFVARLWLGERYAGEQAFRGRSTDRRRLHVPMADLRADGGEHELLLAKDGPGRLYYRLGLQYAPADLELEPLDRGFEVARSYEGLDDPGDVRRGDDGTWHVRAGARVRVTVSMTARSRRHHVALVDPLPAGLEPLDPSLATTATDAATTGSRVGVVGADGFGGPGREAGHWWWWARPWYDHQNLRDDRAEAFASLLWEGSYEYRYAARATTPGEFVVPPPRAEEMYTPETFGRGGTDRVVVA